jgi:methionyl-tRNA formyltransferase
MNIVVTVKQIPDPNVEPALEGERLKIWRARIVHQRLAPGELTAELTVGCGEDALEILELQRAGGRRLSAADFLRGHTLGRGARFG